MKHMSQRLVKVLGLVALTGVSGLADAQSTFSWSPAGPIYTSGRARNIIVDANDPSGNTLFVGSAASGIFKTTNGGANWAALDDQGTVKNISYLAQSTDKTIYA